MNAIQYTGDGLTTRFTVPFGFVRPSDLFVYVNSVATSFSVQGSQIVLDSAPANGLPVLIQRQTDITLPIIEYTDTGALFGSQLNISMDQCRFAIEDLSAVISGGVIVNPGGGGGGGGGTTPNTPDPTATDQFLASGPSGGGFVWQLKTVAQMQSLLGINTGGTTDARLPAPNTANTFLTVNSSGTAYQLSSVATVKNLLGVPTVLLPDINNRQNNILTTNAAGTAYELSTPADLRSKLSLGTAALVNTGTSVGNVPVLVSSGSGPALPAIWGGNLTGIAKSQDFCSYTKLNVATGSPSWTNVFSSPTQEQASSTTFETATGSGVSVPTGVYRVRVEWESVSDTTINNIKIRLSTSGGTVTSPTTYTQQRDGGSTGSAHLHGSLEAVFRVTAGPSTIVVEGQGGVGGNVDVRVLITKVE